MDHEYNTVVVGTGDSGIRAAMGFSKASFKTGCVMNIFPTRDDN